MSETEIHRTAKLFLDNEEVDSPEAALQRLQDASIAVAVGDEVREMHSLQAALLTCVNAGARTFLGGVYVLGSIGDACVLPDLPGPSRLAHAVEFYGGTLNLDVSRTIPLLVLGNAGVPDAWEGPIVRVTWQAWCARVTSNLSEERLADDNSFPPAAIHAAAMGLSECFQYLFTKNPMATRRTWTTSLYRPDFTDNPLDMSGPSDPLLLPTKLWFIGLGHLGQAYLWNLLCMRYPLQNRPEVVLQDVDVISQATLSTGMLAFEPSLGRLKSREMCRILESAGYRVRLVERRFDDKMIVQQHEPFRALSGLDNLEDRSILDQVGFTEVIDAGLGASAQGFMSYQVRVFPTHKTARESLARDPGAQIADGNADKLVKAAGYRRLEEKLGACGIIEVAKQAVGAPFVGTAVAALVIAETVRSTMTGEPRFYGVTGSLRGPDSTSASVRIPPPVHNLGFVKSL